MTLKYKLIGKPGNIEEFLYELEKRDIKQVRVRCMAFPFPKDPNSLLISEDLILESPDGKVRYKKEIKPYFYLRSRKIDGDVCRVIYGEAKRLAKELERRGFEVIFEPVIFLLF